MSGEKGCVLTGRRPSQAQRVVSKIILVIYSAFPAAVQRPPDGKRNPLGRRRAVQRLTAAGGFAAGLQRLPAQQINRKKKKKDKKASSRRYFIVARHVFLGSLSSREPEDSEGAVTGAAGPGGCHGQLSLVVESSVDVPAHAAASPCGLCRCVLGDPESKINRGEFRTGVEIDDQASGEPRGAPQWEATLCSLEGGGSGTQSWQTASRRRCHGIYPHINIRFPWQPQ